MMVGRWIRSIRLVALVPLACVLWAVGCASSGGGGTDGGSRDVITRAEIAQSGLMNTYEVIRQLRPAFLQRRRARSIEGDAIQTAVVYVDGAYRGELRELELIPAAEVQEIRYLDATDATMRYGTGHSGGAILVTTRAG